MATQSARIGKLKGDILAHVMPLEVFGKFGVKKPMPKNSSETVVFRRWLPKGATVNSPNIWSVDPAAHQLSEGETPVADTVTAQDITVSLVEYGFVYRWTNRVEDLYEDDVPAEIRQIAGERMGLLLEMVRWGKLKAGTNVFRAGNVAARANIVALISANMLRNIARSLQLNRAMKISGILSASPNIGTQPVEAAYVVVCSTDLEADIRSQLSGFIHVSEYGSRQTMHENELGSWENFRFITSPHLTAYLAAGGTTTANTRLTNGIPNSAGTEQVDVYPFIVLSQQAFGDVALRGKSAMKVNARMASEVTKDDILGQRGLIGCQTYFASVRLNELQMAVGECAASSL